MRWAYGVTTVPERGHYQLPTTLDCLKGAGFPRPRLFVDGSTGEGYSRFDLPISARWPKVYAFGNFWMGLLELYLREPTADRFAMFQDDILICRNVREYLESITWDEDAYYNLMTYRGNQDLCPRLTLETYHEGWYQSNQMGKGAQALVFGRGMVQRLFSAKHWVERPLGMKDGEPQPERARKNLDGGIIASVKQQGGKELVHNPSLVQHQEGVSTIGNDYQSYATSFRGVEWDAMSMIPLSSPSPQ
jgi:hypothetical protein